MAIAITTIDWSKSAVWLTPSPCPPKMLVFFAKASDQNSERLPVPVGVVSEYFLCESAARPDSEQLRPLGGPLSWHGFTIRKN